MFLFSLKMHFWFSVGIVNNLLYNLQFSFLQHLKFWTEFSSQTIKCCVIIIFFVLHSIKKKHFYGWNFNLCFIFSCNFYLLLLKTLAKVLHLQFASFERIQNKKLTWCLQFTLSFTFCFHFPPYFSANKICSVSNAFYEYVTRFSSEKKICSSWSLFEKEEWKRIRIKAT